MNSVCWSCSILEIIARCDKDAQQTWLLFWKLRRRKKTGQDSAPQVTLPEMCFLQLGPTPTFYHHAMTPTITDWAHQAEINTSVRPQQTYVPWKFCYREKFPRHFLIRSNGQWRVTSTENVYTITRKKRVYSTLLETACDGQRVTRGKARSSFKFSRKSTT